MVSRLMPDRPALLAHATWAILAAARGARWRWRTRRACRCRARTARSLLIGQRVLARLAIVAEGPGTPSQCLSRIAPLYLALTAPSRPISHLALATQVTVAVALGQYQVGLIPSVLLWVAHMGTSLIIGQSALAVQDFLGAATGIRHRLLTQHARWCFANTGRRQVLVRPARGVPVLQVM